MKKFDSSCMEASKLTYIEDAPLIPKFKLNVVLQRYRKSKKCVTSRSAIVDLELFSCHLYKSPAFSYKVPLHLAFQYYLIADSIFSALINFFYPVGGILAHLKFGRYKTIISSIWMLVVSTPLLLIDSGLLVTVLEFTKQDCCYFYATVWHLVLIQRAKRS